jgi:hypothetical protein
MELSASIIIDTGIMAARRQRTYGAAVTYSWKKALYPMILHLIALCGISVSGNRLCARCGSLPKFGSSSSFRVHFTTRKSSTNAACYLSSNAV